ncbi:NAD(P)/FAD-dependent oxidoreductase [Aliamphritea hakodatensis]|uniref:NAD(P)/FAD-dependent oxidoreductase n=1 Tax=Aliamphritea hakodatensis TaxID=2895352 RepID=UPI0022FD4C62|nr:NAD(P)/FAD-dependent oxidoreductase [Aliamphritea hakodatensis]
MESRDVVIIGAGASGLMTAATAGYRGRDVLVLEHTKKVGRKILMSGGGRCNFTNIHNSPDNFLSANAHFSKSALSRYKAADFIELVERHGVEFHEKTLGQLFCNESSKEILQLLLTECDWSGTEIRTETSVNKVEALADGGYRLETTSGELQCQSLVIATGGLSIPNGGATSFAYDLARQFGMEVTELQAALVPFTLQPKDLEHFKPLSGVSHPVTASIGKVSFRENMLFTHRGISGPAILQISSYWQPGTEVTIDLFPELDLSDWLLEAKTQHGKADIVNQLAQLMSKRMSQTFCELWNISGPMNQFDNKKLAAIADQFHNWTVKPSGTEGYRTAEVTLGGIITDEVSSKTFEAKKAPGLYFVGECLDVTGHLGGHNFQWAWACGFAAGQFV